MEITRKKEEKKKSFFERLLEKLDRKLEVKAKQTPCCRQTQKAPEDSCCS